MRNLSLPLKLSLAFVIVVLTAVGAVAFYVWRTTLNEFGTFMVVHNRGEIAEEWAKVYVQQGGWRDLAPVTAPPPPADGETPARFPSMSLTRERMAVVDGEGVIVFPGQGFRLGDQVPRQVFRQGVPIMVNDQEVGRLLLEYTPTGSWGASDRFMRRFSAALFWGGGIAALLAILLGVSLSQSMTKPLRELRTAAEAVSRGEQVAPIAVTSLDELGQLAKAFNLMTAEIERSKALRRQMTADIAHELRTPLSLILGHAEAISDGVLAPDHETMDIIRDEAVRLARVVDDLRTLSLSDAGELSLLIEPVSPVSLLESAAVSHRVAAQEARVELVTEPCHDMPDVEADSSRILQVLDNLLGNALRYTPSGGRVVLSASAHEEGVVFSVADNGPGIPAEELDGIFERFYRVDQSRQRGQAGSGLGLSIARSLVERHGGRMWVSSEPGSGATFFFTLPQSQPI